MECYRCGTCCDDNMFDIEELSRAIFESREFSDHMSGLFSSGTDDGLLKDEVEILRGMSPDDLTSAFESYEHEYRKHRDEMRFRPFYDLIEKESAESCSSNFDPESILIGPDKKGHVIYRMKLKLSHLGRDWEYNPNPEPRHCAFLEMSDDLATCLIHPEYMKQRGIELKTDARGDICTTNPSCTEISG